MNELAVVGGGLVGLATALALAESGRHQVTVLEAEDAVAGHQSGHNSGVIHAGLYYRPGSLKARTCVAGRDALYAFCHRHGIPAERCGKLVVATEPAQLPALETLAARARGNGLDGVVRLDPDGIRAREPQARGVAGLWVEQTGIVDFVRVAQAMAEALVAAGGRVVTGARLTAVARDAGGLRLETAAGPLRCAFLINCAGLHSDRVAALCGIRPEVRIVPFRGQYYQLRPERRALVRGLLYPVPDPRFPFLGVHLTRTVDGRLLAGPNAVLALAREGYRRGTVSWRDLASTFGYPGTWRLLARYPRTAGGELLRAASKRRFAAGLRRLVPAITAEDLVDGPSGVRAQAVDRAGRLLDDFRIARGRRSVHVLNAPSPAATASLAIGRAVAAMVPAGDRG